MVYLSGCTSRCTSAGVLQGVASYVHTSGCSLPTCIPQGVTGVSLGCSPFGRTGRKTVPGSTHLSELSRTGGNNPGITVRLVLIRAHPWGYSRGLERFWTFLTFLGLFGNHAEKTPPGPSWTTLIFPDPGPPE